LQEARRGGKSQDQKAMIMRREASKKVRAEMPSSQLLGSHTYRRRHLRRLEEEASEKEKAVKECRTDGDRKMSSREEPTKEQERDGVAFEIPASPPLDSVRSRLIQGQMFYKEEKEFKKRSGIL